MMLDEQERNISAAETPENREGGGFNSILRLKIHPSVTIYEFVPSFPPD